MDVKEQRLLESLSQAFAPAHDGRGGANVHQRVLFWCDPEAQFAELIPRLSLGERIEVIDLERLPALGVKLRLQRNPSLHFLLYSAAVDA